MSLPNILAAHPKLFCNRACRCPSYKKVSQDNNFSSRFRNSSYCYRRKPSAEGPETRKTWIPLVPGTNSLSAEQRKSAPGAANFSPKNGEFRPQERRISIPRTTNISPTNGKCQYQERRSSPGKAHFRPTNDKKQSRNESLRKNSVWKKKQNRPRESKSSAANFDIQREPSRTSPRMNETGA